MITIIIKMLFYFAKQKIYACIYNFIIILLKAMWSCTDTIIGPSSCSFTLEISKAWQKKGEPKTGFVPCKTSILYVPNKMRIFQLLGIIISLVLLLAFFNYIPTVFVVNSASKFPSRC